MAKAKTAKKKTTTKKKPTAKTAKKTSTAKKTATAKSKTAQLKTRPTPASVDAFIDALPAPRNSECRELAVMMTKATGAAPKMWGGSIVGFGDYHYKYASGREGDFFLLGFSPRKAALTLYVSAGYQNQGELLAKLGKHSVSKSCLYVKRLADLDKTVLATLLDRGVKELKARLPA